MRRKRRNNFVMEFMFFKKPIKYNEFHKEAKDREKKD